MRSFGGSPAGRNHPDLPQPQNNSSNGRECQQMGDIAICSGDTFFCSEKREITMDLAERKCTTYRMGFPPLTRKEIFELLGEVPGWSLDNGHLTRMFELDGSDRCVEFFIEVMALSSQEGHIPDICMKETKFVEISYYTYPAGGLTVNDFIMAAKLNALK
ncbi:MAG TPA: 4a-hydroxytetrahydrobiopterin dehydratase [Methanoregula sp.]|nr:4a-hydroxytetrahydrobiopterin dehydratase [Methanoregula sp.]